MQADFFVSHIDTQYLGCGVVVGKDFFIISVPRDAHIGNGRTAQSPDINVA